MLSTLKQCPMCLIGMTDSLLPKAPAQTRNMSRASRRLFLRLRAKSSLLRPSSTNHPPTRRPPLPSTHSYNMLPTPDTSHVPYSQVYEPAEDSFLLLDTISSASETAFLHHRFAAPSDPAPLVVEVGSGSGVVIGFVNAHALSIFGRPILTAGVDVNGFACVATEATVQKAAAEQRPGTHGQFLGALRGDLLSSLVAGQVDVLIFNPPYVPTEELPPQDERLAGENGDELGTSARFERDSYLLSLSYAGGKDGMEITDRLIAALPEALSARGCAYILLCAGNQPEEVKARILELGPGWRVLTVGESGKQAGWEKLQIIRIWREEAGRSQEDV